MCVCVCVCVFNQYDNTIILFFNIKMFQCNKSSIHRSIALRFNI